MHRKMGIIIRLLQLCLLGTFCRTQRHSGNFTDLRMENRICPTQFQDADDNLGYDLISQYGLDGASDPGPGVRRITGSNVHQTAYRIRRNADLRVPTRAVFLHGLPAQFSFSATLRMTDSAAQKAWDVMRIEAEDGSVQFSVHINGRKKSVRLKFLNNRNRLRPVEFSLDNQYFRKFFNADWHKLSVSVSRHVVELFVDCDKVGSAALQSLGPINTTGNITSGRRTDGEIVMFDLQWLMLYCDPKSAERDQCKELLQEDKHALTATSKQLSDQHEIERIGFDAGVRPEAKTRIVRPRNASIERSPRRYSALTLAKRRHRDSLPEPKDLSPVADSVNLTKPSVSTPRSGSTKKPPKEKIPQAIRAAAIGPPGPPGIPGLPGLPGMPCLCGPGSSPSPTPVPPPPLDFQELERNHGVS